MSFKHKFHVNPQHDSEGFTMQDAKCVGCGPDDMGPRSGHRKRYDSPLRYQEEQTQLMLANAHVDGYTAFSPAAEMDIPLRHADQQLANILLDGLDMPWCDHCQCWHHTTARCINKNPPGWNEVDGVKLPPITWAELTDEQLEQMFQLWLHSSTKPVSRKVEQRQEITAMLQRFHSIEERRS